MIMLKEAACWAPRLQREGRFLKSVCVRHEAGRRAILSTDISIYLGQYHTSPPILLPSVPRGLVVNVMLIGPLPGRLWSFNGEGIK